MHAARPSRADLHRPSPPMPADVRGALESGQLLAAYRTRPAHQRHDYLAWIARARREHTRDQRLQQMLNELACGDRYMNMAWRQRTPTG